MIYNLEGKILNIKIDSLYVGTIQEFFDAFIPSKKIQHLLIQNKWITLDGNPCKRESDIVGQYLNINIYPEEYNYQKVNLNLDIVYEDEFILIANKPKDILVHSDGNDELTLTDIVKSYYVDKPFISAYPIHRLDKETCGLVIFSKSIIFQPLFDKLLSNKEIRRNYLAFTKGKCVLNKTYTIDKPIGNDRHNSNKRIIYENGQSALTKAKCLVSSKGVSIFRCTLDTGRTHQIRLHLSHIGYPLLNDDLYGVRSDLLKRMGLIANEIDMYHPLKEETLNIEIDLPKDMTYLYNDLI